MRTIHPALIFFVVTGISLLTGLIAVSQQSSPQDDLSAVLEQGRAVALSQIDAGQYGPIVVDPADVRVEGDYAFGLAVVRAKDGVHMAPRLILFVARRIPGGEQNWEAVAEGTTAFEQWLAQAPESILPSSSARDMLLYGAAQGIGPLSGSGAAGLSLPFATGETWYVNGPHQGPGIDMPRPALDMSMATGSGGYVRAAADGVVWRSAACPNYVRVDHNATWGTGYYHLFNEAVSNGQAITRGTILGNQGTGIGCGGFAGGDHVHFSILRNGVESYIHGHNIGGYMVEASSRPYEGCMTRVRDSARLCHQAIPNEGTIGAGATDILTTWLFNHDLVGFTAGSNITHTGYSSSKGAAQFRIDAANPAILSPVFNLTTPSTHALVSIQMATRNDACASVYFRRSGEAAFDSARRVDFVPIADGISRDYVVDMSANTNWNGAIVQLQVAPGCTVNPNIANRTITLDRVQISRKPVANTNLVVNGSFASCFSGWSAGQDYWTASCTGSALRAGRLGDFIGFLSIFQDLGSAATVGMPFEITVQLANFSASTTHQVAVGLRDPDTLGNALMCTFNLPPNMAYTTHTIRGRLPFGWNETRFDFSPITLSTSADIGITAVNVQYRPAAAFGSFECIPSGSAQPTPTITPTPSPPDLRITITSPQGPTVPFNTALEYVFLLENVGGASAGTVNFTADVPTGLFYGGGWYWNHNGGFTCSLSGRRVTCTSALMSPSNWLEVRMLPYANAVGSFSIVGNATLGETDANPANNTNVTYTVAVGSTATPTSTPTATATATPTPTPVSALATINGGITLEGRPAPPHALYAVPVAVTVTRTGDGAVVFHNTLATTTSGRFTVPNLPVGQYRVRVKHSQMLSVAQTVTLVAGVNTIEFGVLRAGDADGSNSVNIADFSILAASFGLPAGQGGYDGRADFNGDALVNIGDFSLLAAYFGQSGID